MANHARRNRVVYTRFRARKVAVLDVTMIATTVGCAAMANMLFPGLGSTIVGALLGAAIGLKAVRSE